MPVIPYINPIFPLVRLCLSTLEGKDIDKTRGMILSNRGILAFGATVQTAYENLFMILDRAEIPVELGSNRSSLSTRRDLSRQELAALRQSVSGYSDQPLIMSTYLDHGLLDMTDFDVHQEPPALSPVLVDDIPLIRPRQMVGRDVNAYVKKISKEYQEIFSGATPSVDMAPRIVIDLEGRFHAFGQSASIASLARNAFLVNLAISRSAEALGISQPLSIKELLEAEDSFQQESRYPPAIESRLFQGEIALVTGGASGIGKACVQALLNQGAVVVSLDINPNITTCFNSPEYLGLICDLTNEDAVLNAFDIFTRSLSQMPLRLLRDG